MCPVFFSIVSHCVAGEKGKIRSDLMTYIWNGYHRLWTSALQRSVAGNIHAVCLHINSSFIEISTVVSEMERVGRQTNVIFHNRLFCGTCGKILIELPLLASDAVNWTCTLYNDHEPENWNGRNLIISLYSGRHVWASSRLHRGGETQKVARMRGG
jgi:hypothetical protein